MTDIAAHIRVFEPNPDDDFVSKREAAVKELATKYAKGQKGIPVYIRSANDLAHALETKGQLNPTFITEIEGTLKKHSVSFVTDGHELEMKVCAALAAIQALENAKPSTGIVSAPDLFAVALWSALSFQKPLAEPRLEAIRAELQSKAHALVVSSAASARRRTTVAEFDSPPPKELTQASIKEAADSASKSIVDALRTNAALDREELDFLWWVLGDWSAPLSRRYSTAENKEAAAISAGFEAGGIVRRLPAEAHKQLVLRMITGDGQCNLPDLLKAAGDDVAALAAFLPDNPAVTPATHVFPLLTAIKTGKSANDAKSKVKRNLSDWGIRALLEASILRVAENPSGVAL